MISEDGQSMVCDAPDCDAAVKNHAWGRIKAEGWLFLKDGRTFCPNDLPSWYETWKDKRDREAREKASAEAARAGLHDAAQEG